MSTVDPKGPNLISFDHKNGRVSPAWPQSPSWTLPAGSFSGFLSWEGGGPGAKRHVPATRPGPLDPAVPEAALPRPCEWALFRGAGRDSCAQTALRDNTGAFQEHLWRPGGRRPLARLRQGRSHPNTRPRAVAPGELSCSMKPRGLLVPSPQDEVPLSSTPCAGAFGGLAFLYRADGRTVAHVPPARRRTCACTSPPRAPAGTSPCSPRPPHQDSELPAKRMLCSPPPPQCTASIFQAGASGLSG